MPYSDPQKKALSQRNYARRQQGYKRGSRRAQFTQEFPNYSQTTEFLCDEESQILSMYYGLDGDPQTLKQVGEHLNCSRQHAQTLRDRALQKLRKISSPTT